MAAGTLYTYPENFRAYKVLAAANYSGFKLEVDSSFQYGTTNKTPEFQAKFPLGKVPAFESSDGVYLNESNAIALFVSNDQLQGTTQEAKAQVLQWMSFADQEILPAVCTWVFPCMGVMQYNKQNTERSKEEIKSVLTVLNNHLASRTFLVGNRVTLADLSVASVLLLAYKWVLEPEFRAPYLHANRWFDTVIHQPNVQKAMPADFKMCEKMAQFDAKLYAEMSGDSKKKGGDKKQKEKSAKKEQPKKEQPKKEQPKKEEQPAAEDPPAEKKPKDPFLQFPASETFIMDEWKKVYSNEETDTVSIPWFWKHFDAEKYSVWHGTYNFNDDLSAMDFMNVNLIKGMQQRLDGMRKHGFGIALYFSAPSKSLTGLYMCRGPELPFSLSPDLNVDAESYTWTRMDVSDEKTKKLINEYLMCEGEFDGKELYDYKIFK